MIRGRRDTIAAVATAAGPGGVGVIRVSGADSIPLVAGLIGRRELVDRRMTWGIARDRNNERIDEVLVVGMRGPRSFTGEDVAEVHGHGGVMNMARLLRAVCAAGARPAEAGEFTRRAFENGRLDLVRAEAIADVIEASSERAWRVAQQQLSGELGRQVHGLRERATELLAEIEACIDFPEEGEEFLASAMVAQRAEDLGRDLETLAGTFTLGRALTSGVEIAILGVANAGKSSLFNALLGEERALVDSEPGTTRDFVDARAVWDGVPVTLIDTAGERPAEGVEFRGIELGQRRAEEADVLLMCHPGPSPTLPAGSRERELHIITKADLLAEARAEAVCVSARTGVGVAELRAAILDKVLGGQREAQEGTVVTSERQRIQLERAAASLHRAARGARQQLHTELVAVDVRDSAERLAEILGERVGDDVLDVLFARFCIGK